MSTLVRNRATPIETVPDQQLPPDWAGIDPSPAAQDFGARWASEHRTPVLSVPSAIISWERNFVLNPAHPGFDQIHFLPPQPFTFDRRLK